MSLAYSLDMMSIYKNQLYLQLQGTKMEKRNFKINVIYNSTRNHERIRYKSNQIHATSAC